MQVPVVADESSDTDDTDDIERQRKRVEDRKALCSVVVCFTVVMVIGSVTIWTCPSNHSNIRLDNVTSLSDVPSRCDISPSNAAHLDGYSMLGKWYNLDRMECGYTVTLNYLCPFRILNVPDVLVTITCDGVYGSNASYVGYYCTGSPIVNNASYSIFGSTSTTTFNPKDCNGILDFVLFGQENLTGHATATPTCTVDCS